jgi:hypothetical protein
MDAISVMNLAEMRERLSELGQRIERKRHEHEVQGVLHGDDRKRVIDLKIASARLERLAKSRQQGSSHPDRDAELSGEVEALRLTVERWIAGIDQGF